MVVSSLQTDSRGEQDSRLFSCFRNGRCLFSQTSCESDEALPGPAAADGVGGGAGGGGTVIGVRAVAACQTETGHEGLAIRGLASTLKAHGSTGHMGKEKTAGMGGANVTLKVLTWV